MGESLVPSQRYDVEVGSFANERDRLDAMGYEEISLGMSNFDHRVDAGFEEAWRGGKVYGRHAGWDFNGLVWFDGQQFAEEVWVYRSPREVMRADTLEGLMEVVSDKYGYG